MGIKGVAQIDGKSVEVELTEVKDLDGHFTKEQADARTEGAVRERLKNHKSPEQLMDDEGFTKKFFERHGIDPKGNKKLDPEEIQRLRETFRKEEVEPLKTELTTKATRLTSIEKKRITSDLTASLLEAGFKKPIAAKLAQLHASDFGLDEHDNTSQKDGDGFAFSAAAQKGKPYIDSLEWAKKLAGDPDNAELLEKRSTQDTAAPDGKRRGSTPNIKLTRKEASQRKLWDEAHRKAKELGVEVEVE